MNAFLEAYTLHGHDIIAIADALGIPEHEADRLINAKMNARAYEKSRWQRTKAENAEIRRRHGA